MSNRLLIPIVCLCAALLSVTATAGTGGLKRNRDKARRKKGKGRPQAAASHPGQSLRTKQRPPSEEREGSSNERMQKTLAALLRNSVPATVVRVGDVVSSRGAKKVSAAGPDTHVADRAHAIALTLPDATKHALNRNGAQARSTLGQLLRALPDGAEVLVPISTQGPLLTAWYGKRLSGGHTQTDRIERPVGSTPRQPPREYVSEQRGRRRSNIINRVKATRAD